MEDFRPRSLDEIVGQPVVVARLRRLALGVRNGHIVPPALLLHGPPGSGKTTAARAFAREILGDHYLNSFTELKAFDDRGPHKMAGMILDSRQPPTRGAPFRILFFDEVEALGMEAQNALRPAIEGEGGTTLYLLACNDISMLSKALQSRCTILEFVPLGPDEMRVLLARALAKTPFDLDAPTIESIVTASGGNPRDAIKLLLEEGGARAPPAPAAAEAEGRTGAPPPS
jgi:DNA polymerase III delta prime subunit